MLVTGLAKKSCRGPSNSVIKDNEESALDRGFYSAALGFEITEVQEFFF
jgi:hypothetical protein